MDIEERATPFDNRYTLLYKAAFLHGTLARLIIIMGNPEDLNYYIPLQSFMVEQLKKEVNLSYIYDLAESFSLSGLNFSTTDFVNSYILIKKKSQEYEENKTRILDDINLVLKNHNLATINNVKDLEYIHDNWVSKIREQYTKDQEYTNYLSGLQEEYEEKEPLPQSDLEFNKVTIKFIPLFLSKEPLSAFFNDTVPEAGLGEEIFDQSYVSSDVPLVIYTDHNDKTYSKIWKDFALKSLIPNTPPLRNTFFILLWTGIGTEKITKESYTIARYDLNNGEVTVETPIGPKRGSDVVLNRLEEALPLKVNKTYTTKTGGFFRIYGIELVEPFFLDMLLLNIYFYSFLYTPEESRPAYEKKKFTLHLRTIPLTETASKMPSDLGFSSTVAATVGSFVSSGEPFSLITPSGVIKKTYPVGTPYVIVNITRANNSIDARQFQEIFNRVCTLYLENIKEGSVVRDYEAIIGKNLYLPEVKKERKVGKGTSTLNELRQLAPNIFVEGYSRMVCQLPSQPIIVPDNEIQTWENKTFTRKGEKHKRQVMKYPKDTLNLNIVCPGENRPYPGVKKNKVLSNKEEFPYVPCCFGRNQMSPSSMSKYNIYYKGYKKKETKGFNKPRITTSKIGEFGREGALPSILVEFLASFFPTETDFIRIGVPHDTNSAISSVYLATTKGVENLSVEQMRETSSNIRQTVNFYPSLLKQEFYDSSDEVILRDVRNSMLFFDPYYFYRILEEYFDVNVVTFTLYKNIPKIEIPRSYPYYCRTYKNRPLVLLYKNFGSESNALTYPQIELIVNGLSKDYTFDERINMLMFEAIKRSSSTYFWTFLPNKKETFSKELAFANYLQPFREITGQVLDDYGKLRGVTADGLTVYFPPSEPLNLPIVKGGTNRALNVIDKFGNPNALSYDNGITNGFWYEAFSYKYTFYFPIESTSLKEIPKNILENVSEGPSNPFPTRKGHIMLSYSELTQKRNIILQLISWLFLTTKEEWPKEDIVNWFRDNFTIIGNENKSNYDFSKISRVLPILNIEEALDYLSNFPGLIVKNRIFLYNSKFAAGVFYFLSGIFKSTILEIPREVFGIPYKSKPFALIFDNWEQTQRWERSTKEEASIEVYDLLEETLNKKREPFFYIEDVLYLVQNTTTLNDALYIVAYWREHHINLGYEPERVAGKATLDIPYRLYNISSGGKLKLVSENPEPSSVEILEYENNTHAALLILGKS